MSSSLSLFILRIQKKYAFLTGKRLFLLFLSLCSASFLCLSWEYQAGSFLLFFAFVPLFLIEHSISGTELKKRLYFTLIYFTYLIWNVYATKWLYNTSVVSSILIQVLNPLILSLPWIFFSVVRKKTSKIVGYSFLISAYVLIEYFHFNWDLKFPLFTLGNGFGKNPEWVQFYEYTGVFGGTIWILISNIVVFECIQAIQRNGGAQSLIKPFISMGLVILLPLVFSICVYHNYEEIGENINTVVIHPSLDCRTEKYDWDLEKITSKYIELSLQKVDSTTDYVIWPETAIPDIGWLSNLHQNTSLKSISTALNSYDLNLITGAIAYEGYHGSRAYPEWKTDNLLKFHKPSKVWYKTYNSAIQLHVSSGKLHFRSKKELVPVEETVPFNGKLTFLRKAFPSLGGYLFSTRKSNTNVFPSESGNKVSTLICYESLFGELTAQYVSEGAGLLFVILNEGWYKDIQGASQLMHISRIRAIENRRAIARSSNDGISCFIDQKGDIVEEFSEFKSHSLKATLVSNTHKTFYTRYGDYLVKLSIIVFLTLSIQIAFKSIKFYKNQ